MIEFQPFPKISRLNRDIIVTEKIDGTNACVIITEDGEIGAQSRNGLITPGKTTDNFGFAAWVEENSYELTRLGPGRHYGEWWGHGIQRGYGLPKGERRFSLFNVSRWGGENESLRPSCCEVVPTLYAGPFDQHEINACLETLIVCGSRAAPGFVNAEGIIVFHTASGALFKTTCVNDEKPKSLAA